MSCRGRLLLLWNQTEEDIYERWREGGPQPLSWSPERLAPDVGTVKEEMDALIAALGEGGFDVSVVNAEDDLDRVLGAIRLNDPDAIFNLVEFFNDDATHEAYIAGLYELMGVAYTGSRPRCLATCMDKHRTKLILTAAGLPTARFFRCHAGAEIPADHGLRFPLIVKPSQEDASGGIEPESVVWDQAALEERVHHILKEFEQPALIEEYIEGREIHAAVLGNDPPEVLPLFEMEFDDTEFNPEGEWRPQIISFRAKWDPHSKAFYSMDARVPPEDLDDELAERIEDVALRAFRAMECRDYARVDMRVDDDGQIFILEVNPNPDLVDGTAYMQCAVASGRTFSETLSAIADMAIARGRHHHAPAAIASTEAEAHPGAAPLPSDQLLREHVLREQA
ncbi:MAG TPA: hypothetical protein VFG83_12160, partial [Kofleriaceae bacterium]|nr:hypothetical protein [Kofleriaceae bacterium]